MIQKKFDSIEKGDIEFLVTNKNVESKTLEFKEKLPGNRERDKKEFLADVSSFANASGGDMIFGIKDVDGEANEVTPIQGKTADEAKLWIEDVVRAGIEPRMPMHIKEVTGFGSDGNGFIVIIRIPQSFASPHMITYKNWSRFYCRHSSGKYQLDIQEIRSSFLATDSQAERIRHFLQERLAKIMANETPLTMANSNRLALHIIPLNSFLNNKRFDFNNNDMSIYFRPIRSSGWNKRFNLDGFLTHRSDRNSQVCISYCQTFFNGVIESVYADILSRHNGEETPYIASIAYERYLVESIKNYFTGYKALGVEAPLVISVSLLNCKGAYLYVNSDDWDEPHVIDREVAVLPEVQVESFDEEVPAIMKPIFDSVWNACGYQRSFNYTEDGVWDVDN